MRRILLTLSLLSFLTVFGLNADAQEHTTAGKEGETKTEAKVEEAGKLDVAGEMFGHVGDSHEIHIFTINGHPVVIPLPVILYDANRGLQVFSSHHFNFEEGELLEDGKSHRYHSDNGYYIDKNIKEKVVAADGAKVYDFSITKNVVCMLISVLLILWIFTSVAKKYRTHGTTTAPKGFQNALEPVINFIRDEVAKPNLGFRYMRYMPLLLTLFFFIWLNNLLGLLPLGLNFTGNIAVTLCLALVFFVVMLVSANKHFWSHLLNPPGVPFGVKLLLVPIEIISLFVKPIALTIRLFANILAGHIVILSVIFMIFIFGHISRDVGAGFVPVSLIFAVFMFLLELMVGAIQAFIFVNLTAVFIGQSIEEPVHHHDDHHHAGVANEVTGQDYHVSESEIIA